MLYIIHLKHNLQSALLKNYLSRSVWSGRSTKVSPRGTISFSVFMDDKAIQTLF